MTLHFSLISFLWNSEVSTLSLAWISFQGITLKSFALRNVFGLLIHPVLFLRYSVTALVATFVVNIVLKLAIRYTKVQFSSFLNPPKKIKSVELRDTLIVRDSSDVFPDDLPGLPPVRAVEFQIDLVPGATPVAKPPYHLTLFEIQELSISVKPGTPFIKKSICRSFD
jgi:hypothetical protein